MLMGSFQSLVDRIDREQNFSTNVSDYLDNINFYHDRLSDEYFANEPNWKDLSNVDISYLVCILHKYILKYGFRLPRWILNEKFVLKEPVFGYKTDGMLKLVLLLESPYEFRKRNIFVSANAFERV